MIVTTPLWQYVASLSMLPHTRHLSTVEPCCDERGYPICYAGNAALVCKVKHDGRPKVLRVYTAYRNNLQAIYRENYYPLELPILDFSSDVANYADVVLLDWHEGETLQCVLESRYDDEAYMHRLSCSFERAALWLLNQEWAHGDIKPDNIIVNGEEVHFIDFDAMYLPSFRHSDCEEIGSPEYQHPTRSVASFSNSIDDYPLALIITAISAIAYDRSLAENLGRSNGLLISPLDAVRGESAMLERVERLFIERGDAKHYRIAQLLRTPHIALYHLRDYLSIEGRAATDINALTVAAHEGLWGYKEGDEWVIPPLYDLAFDVEQGLCRVVLGNREFLLDAQGQIVKEAL